MTEETDTVMVAAQIPQDVKEAAKQKLDHGGITREIEDLFKRIAYGEDVNLRSRLKRQREQLQERLGDKRRERRELDADIQNLEDRIQELDRKMEGLTTREDKFEAKLEELDAKLRIEGHHLDPEHSAVKRAAMTGQVETGKVLNVLRERNPDVPEYAYKQRMHAEQDWNGLPEEQAQLPLDERESKNE